MEPVAALVARLLRPDGGQLLLADPLERTRPHRHAHRPTPHAALHDNVFALGNAH